MSAIINAPMPHHRHTFTVDHTTYAVEVHLVSTEVFNVANGDRYEYFAIMLHTYSGEDYFFSHWGIFWRPQHQDHPFEYLLDSDEIIREISGEFDDVWDVQIPVNTPIQHSLEDLLDLTPLGEGLPQDARSGVLNHLSTALNDYLEIDHQFNSQLYSNQE